MKIYRSVLVRKENEQCRSKSLYDLFIFFFFSFSSIFSLSLSLYIEKNIFSSSSSDRNSNAFAHCVLLSFFSLCSSVFVYCHLVYHCFFSFFDEQISSFHLIFVLLCLFKKKEKKISLPLMYFIVILFFWVPH